LNSGSRRSKVSFRSANSIRARSTRPAGAVRERAIARNAAKSYSPIANSIARRNPAMTRKPRFRTKAARLKAMSEKMNPPHSLGFKESMN
jgi:hypothetical protein